MNGPKTSFRMPHFICLILSFVSFACGHDSSPRTQVDLNSKSRSSCVQKIADSLQKIDEDDTARAQELDPDYGAIKPENESRVLAGDPEKIVFLLHGFIGSPAEVEPLGLALQKAGYTVVMPLISGMGRSSFVAGNTDAQTWVQQTTLQMKASLACSQKIHLVGFSLGALIESKIALENNELKDKISSLTLISPALQMKNNSVLDATSTLFANAGTSIGVSTLGSVAAFLGNHDLDLPKLRPDIYNDELPLALVAQIKILADAFPYQDFASTAYPLKVIYSEDDHTVDGESAFSYISAVQPDATVYAIPRDFQVPHQVLMTEDATVFHEITENVLANLR